MDYRQERGPGNLSQEQKGQLGGSESKIPLDDSGGNARLGSIDREGKGVESALTRGRCRHHRDQLRREEREEESHRRCKSVSIGLFFSR